MRLSDGSLLKKASELQPIVRIAIDSGWTVELTKSSHVKFRNPYTGKVVVSGSTPSDPRSRLNLKADLRRAGLKI